MHEVHPGIIGDAVEQRVAPFGGVQTVPLHLWPLDVPGKHGNRPPEDAEALPSGRLLAALEQELQAHADAQEGTATVDRLLGRCTCDPTQSRLRQCLGASSEGPHARQHDARSRCDLAGVRREACIGPDAFERLLR